MRKFLAAIIFLVLAGTGLYFYGKSNIQGNLEKGIQAYNADSYQEAEKYFSEAEIWAPRSGEVKTWLGVSLAAQGKDGQALTVLEKAEDFGYKNFALFTSLGDIFYSRGDFSQAEEKYKKALELRPSSEANRRLAVSLVKGRGDKFGALQFALEATSVNPKNADAWSTLASIYADIGEHEAGLNAAEKAVQLNPNLCAAQNNKAYLLLKLDRSREALESANTAIEVASKDENSSGCLVVAYITRAEIYESAKDLTRAVADYEKASSISLAGDFFQLEQEHARQRLNELKQK